MTLTPGSRLGPYEIVGQIGAGGMGEVWKARDTRLGRDVAIKVLPPAFAADLERLRRFEQEARATGALNHPNILAVFDVGTQESAPYLVMELLEGQSLREKLGGKALPIKRALEIGQAVAEGLAAAHAKGIFHRDIKPENLFITKDGRVKILDFGLAKFRVAEVDQKASTRALEFIPVASEAGMLLGTVGYMSPEQVRGETLDARSDLFSLGVVLWEMISGMRPFKGHSQVETLNAILKDEPPGLDLLLQVPPVLERILHQCLAKEPEGRFHSAHDLAFALEIPISSSSIHSGAPAGLRATRWRAWLPWAIVALLLVALPIPWLRTNRVPPPSLEAELALPKDFQLELLMLSPDGATLMIVGAENVGKLGSLQRRIWLRPLGQTVMNPLAGTESCSFPFWSPDSTAIAFFTHDGKLKRIPVAGGPAQFICDAQILVQGGGTWGVDDTIVFSSPEGPLMKVSAAGGTPQAITRLEGGATHHWNPHFLPDGRRLLFNTATLAGPRNPVKSALWGLDVATGKTTLILEGVGEGYGIAPGWLVVCRRSELLAQRMDLKTFQLTGGLRSLEVDVGGWEWGLLIGYFSIAPSSGRMVYLPANPQARKRQFTWLDLDGRRVGLVGEPTLVSDVGLSLSPDGKRVAFGQQQEFLKGSAHLCTMDLERGVPTQLSLEADMVAPSTVVWTRDGREIYLKSPRGIVAQDAVQPGVQRLLTSGDFYPVSVTPDGAQVLLTGPSPRKTDSDVFTLATQAPGEPKPLLASPTNDFYPMLSPDGRWLAYVSDASGDLDVFVVSYPSATARVQITSGGGVRPFWLGRSGTLVYLKGEQYFSVTIAGTGSQIQVGAAKPLFAQMPAETTTLLGIGNYLATARARLVPDLDGRRILATLRLPEAVETKPLRLSTTWLARLEGK